MNKNDKIYRAYVDILHEELVPAMGCTEPIAVALAGALARKTLGVLPHKVELVVSGNIIKNVKSVIYRFAGKSQMREVSITGKNARSIVAGKDTFDLLIFVFNADYTPSAETKDNLKACGIEYCQAI